MIICLKMVNIVEHDTTPKKIQSIDTANFLGASCQQTGSRCLWWRGDRIWYRLCRERLWRSAWIFQLLMLRFSMIFHITCCWCYYPSFGEVNPGADAGQVQWEVVMENLLGRILDFHPSTEDIPRLIALNQKTMLHWVPIVAYLCLFENRASPTDDHYSHI